MYKIINVKQKSWRHNTFGTYIVKINNTNHRNQLINCRTVLVIRSKLIEQKLINDI